MERVFVTHVLPTEYIAHYKLSFAACNFSFNLIKGKVFDRVISTLPVFVKGEIGGIRDENFEFIYSSLRKCRGFISKFATIAEQISVYRLIKPKSNVWFYNLGYLNFLIFILLRIFKRSVNLYVIELDFVPPKNWWSIENLFLFLQNRADGMIKLATSPLFTCKNSDCLAGVTPLEQPFAPQITKVEKSFLISGALYESISNLPMLLETFSKLSDCKLHITGSGFNENIINEYCRKYPNIVYHGMLSFEKYINLLHTVVFQLSTRQPDYPDNECNFPSKIIEALLHNRIVISTIEYVQIRDLKYFKVPSTPREFENEIRKISKMSETELLKYANQSNAVFNKFNPVQWRKIMNQIEENSHKL